MNERISKTVTRVLEGEVMAAARLIRDLDDRIPEAVETLKILFPHTGKARIIGITGNPGAGKSTVVDSLISHYRSLGLSVGVVAVDPTSPFSGGAILGDRIRMQRHSTDPEVFIRSMATRGYMGGLSRSASDAISVMDAMGKQIILVETVGVGQDEVDIVTTAETSVVVVVPGLGDEIQAIKAGILEIADILLVNKADRQGADRTVADLTMMLELRADSSKKVPILKCVATKSHGILELAEAIENQRAFCEQNSQGLKRALQRAEVRLMNLLRERLLAEAIKSLQGMRGLDEMARKIVARKLDPYSAMEEVVALVVRREDPRPS